MDRDGALLAKPAIHERRVDVKHVYQYRTPVTLRAYSKVFIYLIPVLLGPYFAAISLEYSSSLTYVMPVLLSVILVSLDNIQEHLENPFDQVGGDDVIINVEKFLARIELPTAGALTDV
jgi:hypothetical protein